jgi:hypothetical protein
LEEFREVFSFWQCDDLSGEVHDIGFDVNGNCSTFKVIVLSNVAALLSVSHGDHIADFAGVAGHVNEFAIDKNVLVGDHLSGLENGARISESIDLGLESHFQESQKVETSVALHSACSLKRFAELLFKHSIEPSDDLFGKKLLAVLGHSSVAKVGSVLSRRVGSFGGRTLGLSPDIEADFAADVFLSSSICRHANGFLAFSSWFHRFDRDHAVGVKRYDGAFGLIRIGTVRRGVDSCCRVSRIHDVCHKNFIQR